MQHPFATSESIYHLAHAAQFAPSILNTQPWAFRVRTDDLIELWADRSRQLVTIDPRGRELTISCGAALFNLCLAIRVTGYIPVVGLVPRQAEQPDLLASVEVFANRTGSATITEQRLYEMIERRHTDRRPFSRRRIRMNLVAELEQAARIERVTAWLLHGQQTRQLIRMAAAADRELAADDAYQAEVRQWTSDALSGYGVPAAALGPKPSKDATPVRDVGLSWRGDERPGERFEKRARLIGIATDADEPSDWLRAGQALQHLLLAATRYGVSASFLTQPFEASDRHPDRARESRPWGPRFTQIVVRIGRGQLAAAGTPRTQDPDIMDMRVQPPAPIRPPVDAT